MQLLTNAILRLIVFGIAATFQHSAQGQLLRRLPESGSAPSVAANPPKANTANSSRGPLSTDPRTKGGGSSIDSKARSKYSGQAQTDKTVNQTTPRSEPARQATASPLNRFLPPQNEKAMSQKQNSAAAQQRPQSPSKLPNGAAGRSPYSPQNGISNRSKQPSPGSANRPNSLTSPADVAKAAVPPVLRQPLAEERTETRDLSIAKPVDTAVVERSFGMKIESKNDGLYIRRVDRDGNAAQAGLQDGDKLESIGGAPLSSSADLGQIAALLSQGDQIELDLVRDGAPQKVQIQYGKGAGESEASAESENPAASSWSTIPRDEVKRLEKLVSEQQRVITELQQRLRELESSSESRASSRLQLQ
jgi:PDZ domain